MTIINTSLNLIIFRFLFKSISINANSIICSILIKEKTKKIINLINRLILNSNFLCIKII